METKIPEGFTVKGRFNGIIQSIGKSAGQEMNWGYNAIDNTTNQECILLYCNPGVFTIIDNDILDKLRNISDKHPAWFLLPVGYIACHIHTKNIYMHQYLTNHWGNGVGNDSVDHINRNKLDNRLCNLRIVSQSVQNQNTGKRARKKDAKPLPTELQHTVLPKYVVYYEEKLPNGNIRNFFTVEQHPMQLIKEKEPNNTKTIQLLNARWATTKSSKVPIMAKLEQAIHYVSELNRLYMDETNTYTIQKINIIDNMHTNKSHTNNTIHGEENDTQQLPKQWKAKQIYTSIIRNAPVIPEEYKKHCEATNVVLSEDWDARWNTFVSDVRNTNTFQDAEPIIKEFIVNLRTLRHNELCYKRNAAVLERDDREQWPATTVLRAFHEGKLGTFKAWTENYAGDTPEDPAWTKRWAAFEEELKETQSDEERKKLISKFMTAQRTKKYRRSKK